MHIRPFQAVYPNLDFVTSTDSFFQSVREEYNEYRDSGFFQKSAQEALYVYEIRGAKRSFRGIIACADIEDYLYGHIKKHEHTMADKEQKQLQLLLRRQALVKPVLVTYPEAPAITAWTRRIVEGEAPALRVFFEKEEQQHLLWEVRDGALIREIQELFNSDVPDTYIADGHHRSSSSALLYERTRDEELRERYRNLLCAFFPSTDLAIHDFNRVVEGLDDISLSRFMARLAQLFDIEILKAPIRPRRKFEILLFVNEEWYLLHWKKEVLKEYAEEEVILDSMLLNEKVLDDILGIEDIRSDQRIDYVAGPKGLEGLRKKIARRENRVGFCLYPVQLDELITLADHEKVLPPKSTWFEPRMKNGLIVYEI